MKERPILFGGEMVRALLAGTKTQTRRVVNPQPRGPNPPDARIFDFYDGRGKWKGAYDRKAGEGSALRLCPYGQPGDRLWVRETWTLASKEEWDQFKNGEQVWPETMSRPHIQWYGNAVLNVIYRADGEYTAKTGQKGGWCSPIFMERKASRILLEVTDVRVQRVQEISAGDCVAEGVNPTGVDPCDIADSAKDRYRDLWDSISGKRPGCAWADNPWVWALTFKRLTEGSGK